MSRLRDKSKIDTIYGYSKTQLIASFYVIIIILNA